ncbi:MAG: GntR family transcriptional regulator [Rhodothermaceae bacterium]
MSEILRDSIIPLYFQLSEILRTEIKKGVYNKDMLIPSERELCEKFNLSRATVRQAIDLLREEGLIEKVRGKGTKILPEKKYEQDLSGFYNFDVQMAEKGHLSEVEVISFETDYPKQRVRDLLKLDTQEKILIVTRLRKLEGKPLFLETIYLHSKFCSYLNKSDFESTNIFTEALKLKCNVELGEATIYIDPVLLTETECEILDVDKTPSASLLFRRISSDSENNPIILTKRIFRGDKCSHIIKVREK